VPPAQGNAALAAKPRRFNSEDGTVISVDVPEGASLRSIAGHFLRFAPVVLRVLPFALLAALLDKIRSSPRQASRWGSFR
jgi:hypothetical protein